MAKKKKIESQEKFKTMIGGQALIEGILMRGPDKQAVVVRSKGELQTKVEPLKPAKRAGRIPFVRGVVNFLGSMTAGVKALMYSANFFVDEDEEESQEDKKPSKIDAWLEKKMGSEKFAQGLIYFSVALGILFSIGLFFVLPILIGDGLEAWWGTSPLVKNLIEGLVRVILFLGYMILVSRMKDMKRVFSYHGAEHKSIRCYEAKLPLTVENVRKQTRLHPRCGTSFLFVVMIISILLFTVANSLLLEIPAVALLRDSNRIVYNIIMMVVKIVVMLPIVVSVTYELNRWIGRHDNWFTRALSKPGMWMQLFTTNEPDDSMIEVAIEALTLVIPEQEGSDRW